MPIRHPDAPYTNIGTPNADVLAADAWVQRHGVCNNGCLKLITAMFGSLRRDLAWRSRDARNWLDTPEFALWITLCGGDPATARAKLLDDYWRSPIA